jgi:hypothetical protein
MENIIEIGGKRYKVTLVEPELTGLPDKWYTDGTAEANEWAKAVYSGVLIKPYAKFIGSGIYGSNGSDLAVPFKENGHTYITPAQFNDWVYKPWKESLQPKAPTTIEEVWDMIGGGSESTLQEKSVVALSKLYDVAKCLNECFEWGQVGMFYYVDRDRDVDWGVHDASRATDVIRFTSRAAAQHAAKHFWHLFQDFYMLEEKA